MPEDLPKNSREHAVADNWFAAAFGDLYPVVYAHRTVAAAAPEAVFARDQVRLCAGDRVLDCCCGAGRHLAHLREWTPQAVGLDYSADLLRRARTLLGPGIPLVRGDMRHLPMGPLFDVVFSFFTSFGYFSDAENTLAAGELTRVLRPGGRFFMDYLNPPKVRTQLIPHSEQHRDALRIEESRWIDDATRRVNKSVTIWRDAEQVMTYGESVRLYDQEELTTLLHAAGLVVDRVFGACDGRPWNDSAPRQVVLAHKPG